MNETKWRIIGASNHTDSEREIDDYYATDPVAIDRLLAVETPNKRIWECACGGGHLTERMEDFGYCVYSTDIKRRGRYPEKQVDFLTATKSDVPFVGEYDILTNPPYKYAKEFVMKALNLLPQGCKCYMFLKLTFLEGKTRYFQIFKDTPPKKVYVFSERIMCAKNAEFQKMREGGGSCTAYAWFVWEKGYQGKTQLSWL